MPFEFLSTFASGCQVYFKTIITSVELKLVIQKQLICVIVYMQIY